MPPPLPPRLVPPLPTGSATAPALRGHLLLLAGAGLLALAVGRAIGFGLRIDPSRIPVGPLLFGGLLQATLELGLLTACRLGRWHGRFLAVAATSSAQAFVLGSLAGWLAVHADLLGWSLAVVVGLLFLLLLAAAVLALLSLVRVLVYWHTFGDERIGWLAPLATLAPLLAAFVAMRLWP